MSYLKTNRRNYPGLENIDVWKVPEILGLNDETRQDYENKKSAIDQFSNGTPLMLRIGSLVPYRHPSWKAGSKMDSTHILEVEHKTKMMGAFFQARLAKVKEEYERYLPRLPWIDQRPSK